MLIVLDRIWLINCVIIGNSYLILAQGLFGTIGGLLDFGNDDNDKRSNHANSRDNSNLGLHTSNNKDLLNLRPYNPSNINRLSFQSQKDLLDKVNQGNYDDDDVKLAAQTFPQLQNFLNKLKELNKQKELLKQQQASNSKNQGQKPSTTSTTENPHHTGSKENGKGKTQEAKNNNTKGKLQMLMKRKFYFQMQPVIPENEHKEKDQVVYYED